MRFFSFMLLSAAFIFLNGCSKFNDKRFSTTIDYAFEVDIPANGALSVDLNNTITSLINEELKKVKDDIKEYQLVGVRYKIWEFNGGQEPNIFDGTLGIGNLNSTAAGVSVNLAGLDLRAGNDNPNLVNINFTSLDKSRVEQYFKDTNGLKLFLQGAVDQAPVHFKLQVTVDIDAIAEVKKK